MNRTKHQSVLSALEKRALRYHNGNPTQQNQDEILYNDAVDETGTVSTEGLTDSDSESIGRGAEFAETEEIRGVSDELLEVHGTVPAQKPEGATRLIYENSNGFNSRISNNDKLDKAKQVIDDLEPDIVAFNEHKLNLRHKDNKNGFSQMFNGGECEIRAVAANNVHENVGRVQQGGTSMMTYGPMIEQYDFENSGKDETGLGRWCVMTFRGSEGHTTRVVCGYNPCYNKKQGTNTVYQQQRRYLISKEKDLTCPRTRFRKDLVEQLKTWRSDGDRLIVCLDANEHIYDKSIGKTLTDIEGLAMKEVVGDFTGKKLGATYFRGTNPIDGIWATSDVTVVGACVMPVGFGVGDHRLFIIDFLTSSLVGVHPPKIVRAQARRLNTRQVATAERYSEKFEDNIVRHRLIERLGEAHETITCPVLMQEKIDAIDEEGKQYMVNAESKCRKIKSGRIPFSPESSIWIQRAQVYRSLLRFHAKKIKNRGNLKRSARKCGIRRPMHLSLLEIKERLSVCESKCEYFRRHGHKYRRKHLSNVLERAREKEDDVAEKKILAIIQREKDRAFWRRLNYKLGKKRGRSVRSVQVEVSLDQTVEHNTQETVQEAIWDEVHRKRFYLAEQAPICQGNLRGDFGYIAISPTAKAVLAGSYDYPEEFDGPTRELLEECAEIRSKIPKGSAPTLLTREQWQTRWKKAKEDTSSSESGIHFGHYKAGAQSIIISHFHALKTSLALKRGIALTRWSRGLSVMLEKMFGCTLISKLRAILLMEADFNFANKMIYGVRMLDNARFHGIMMEEIFSERNRMADDGTLSKTLFYDIVRVLRVPAAISSVDAANCYDSIAHAIASMVFQSFGVPEEGVQSMLVAIEEMKFFLRTAYGDSNDYAGSTVDVKFQGLCQGNGAAPAGWAVISITILRAHKKKGHGAYFTCPISLLKMHIAGILFVDDTDLIHLNMEVEESICEAHQAMQLSITNWGDLLMASGGSLKPIKCFYHLISFDWNSNGSWKYSKNEQNAELDIWVPIPGGEVVLIDHLSVDESKETLGVFTCPSGDCSRANKAMQEKAQDWIDTAKNGHLHRRQLWFMLEKQFWPRVGYGISSNTSSFRTLTECLKKQYWQLIPLGGIIRTAPAGIRQQDMGFYGAGCPHPGVECLASQINKLLMHFGCHSAPGIKLQIAVEMMILELGVSLQPLQESYKKYSTWVTDGWLKSLWEKVDIFDIMVIFNTIKLEMPRENDKWLMREFVRIGFSKDDLERLNRVRIFQQVLFLSDILGAGGKSIDSQYFKRRPTHDKWSSLRFPREKPPRKDFMLWNEALRQIVPAGGIQDRLRGFTNEGHKIYNWRYDELSNQLHYLKDDKMDIYTSSTVPRYSHTPNRWTRSRLNQPRTNAGGFCTVRDIAPAVFAISSFSAPVTQPRPPSGFMDVLIEWGCTWMWDSLRLVGDETWIEEAIADNSCMAVTDGSYIKELHPNICSAAFMFECSKGRGKLVGSFPEQTMSANAYRGELLGLMAIHLILLSVNKINPTIQGSVQIFSDCLGALDRVEYLPPHRIPSRCKHSDILKNILVNCSDLSFRRIFDHVKAHQDNHDDFNDLSRQSQMNCACDAGAKNEIWEVDPEELPTQEAFPLEPVCVFVGKQKMTSDTGPAIRFWCHRILAKEFFLKSKLLMPNQFEQVDWQTVHTTLHKVPRMFQIWACKQVMDIAGTNFNQSKYQDEKDPTCPSCDECIETCSHVLHCNEEGRVDALKQTITLLENWLREVGTDTSLRQCLVRYARGRGGITMEEIVRGVHPRLRTFARSQDVIGWRRFMEGMISKECRIIQQTFLTICGSKLSIARWGEGLVTKLLECTHGQWLYRNVHVHDSVSGAIASQRKEEIQHEIEKQQDLGEEGLTAEDHYLMEVNLEDLETTSGERQEYWLLAIRAAREAFRLRRIADSTVATGIT